MKKINYFLVLLCVACIFGSCGINQAPFQDYPSTTEVQLNQANYRIIGTAKGYSRQVYVLGIGGLSQKALRQNAIIDMYENANLKGSQAIVNITTALTWSGFPIICTVKRASARGTIIEFIQENNLPVTSVESPYNSASQSKVKSEAQIVNQNLAKKEENKYYIAYLYKSKKLNADRTVLDYFSWAEITELTNTWSINELLKKSANHDKEFEKYAL